MKDSGIQPSQVTYALFTSAVTEAPISPQTRLSVDDFHSKIGPGGGNRKDQPLPPRSSSVDMRPRSKKQVDDVIIWKDVRMSTKSTCPGCNSRVRTACHSYSRLCVNVFQLCDSEIMSGWTDDPTSQTTRCIVCRTTSFTPTLSIVLTFVKKEPQTGTRGHVLPIAASSTHRLSRIDFVPLRVSSRPTEHAGFDYRSAAEGCDHDSEVQEVPQHGLLQSVMVSACGITTRIVSVTRIQWQVLLP